MVSFYAFALQIVPVRNSPPIYVESLREKKAILLNHSIALLEDNRFVCQMVVIYTTLSPL